MARVIISEKLGIGCKFLSEVIDISVNEELTLRQLVEKISIVNSDLLFVMISKHKCVARIFSIQHTSSIHYPTISCPLRNDDEIILTPPSENVDKEWNFTEVEEYYRYA